MSAAVHPQAVVAADAVLEADVVIEARSVVGAQTPGRSRVLRIAAGCYVGAAVVVGPRCVLEPGVVVLDGCVLGADVIVSSGTVLGTDGFGYVEDGGRHHKLPQVGNVEIGDRVHVGAGVCIDRATTGTTRVGLGL